MNLDESLERVEDRDSFFDFVEALIADREDEVEKERRRPSSPYGPGANGWENGSIEAYLAAALAWAQDGADDENADTSPVPEEPSWHTFARILYAGRRHEQRGHGRWAQVSKSPGTACHSSCSSASRFSPA